MNALLDKDFLKELDNYSSKEVYARVTALTVNELPIEMIEGKVTSGSINIDGASAVRRTCSLSMVAQDVNINEFYWGLNNKIKLEIGLKNFINLNYPDIIWFPQGIYVITNFNTSMAANSYNISLNGQDKMCLLNGEVGGSLPASIDFGVEEYHDENDNITYTKIPVKNIIKEMLHTYALEPYHNIIINDLEDKGLELLEYRGDTPLYLLYHIKSGEYINMEFDGSKVCYLSSNGQELTLETIPNYNKRVDELLYDEATKIKLEKNGDDYLVSKIEYGQTAGYRLTELTYPGDLISGIGESITSILDKITKMLGNFEYFYDLDGRFIFQSKKTYVNTSWSPIIETDEDIYVENAAYIDENVYYFNGNNLISSFSNNPDLKNVKNDYSIWGVRKSVTGAELPIHFRYAIQKKPVYYKAFDGTIYTNSDYDWRELIYQMAIDYYKHGQQDNYYTELIKNNLNYYPTGITGYEQFYSDMQGFWRELYNPIPKIKYYEYSYESNDEKQFTTIDKYGNSFPLFIKEKYTKLSIDSDVDRTKVYALREYNGVKELHPLIDIIAIEYNFNQDGEQNKYFITADTESGYKAITRTTYESIEKKEIYVRQDGKFTHILNTVSLDDNCYLREELGEDVYLNVNDLITEIKSLYHENGKFNKYYTSSKINLDGTVSEDAEKVYHNLTYYMESYDYFRTEDAPNLESLYWNKKIKENPDALNFWIDFLDASTGGESELDQYAIWTIGNRPKVVNDTNVKSIYYRNVPNLIFTTDIYNEFKEKTGYVFMQLSEDMSLNYFNISAQGKSAKDALDELLYQHSYCTESINISAIPIYYLEPNTRISVYDELSKINGEYVVSKISIPLTYNGQMSIQATKAPSRFN